MKGTVKFFKEKAGWGFITPDNPAKRDIFVHHTGILMSGYRFLERGDAVEFETVNTDKGPIAYDVTVIKHGEPGKD